MEIVANDMVVRNQFQDKYTAVQEIKKCLDILKILKKNTNFQKLSSERRIFKNWEIAPNYFIEQLFNDQSGLLNKDEKLTGVLKKGDKDVEVKINNIAALEHIKMYEQQLRMWKYEFNEKHAEKYGWGTVMDLSDSEAQELLLQAVSVDNTYKHLIAKKNDKYYSFRRHHGNCYHGYWDDTMQEKYRRLADKSFCG